MSFSFSFVAKKRERKERKERENTLSLPTLLRAFNQMDVASEPALLRSLKNARGANVVHFIKIERNAFYSPRPLWERGGGEGYFKKAYSLLTFFTIDKITINNKIL